MDNNNQFHILIRAAVLAIIMVVVASCQKDDLDDLNRTLYVRHQGADMPAHIYGNGAEKVFLIILHGGPGGNGLTYRTQAFRDEIEQEVAVVYFDQRHSGQSQGNFSKDDITIDLMAEDVMALTKVLQTKYGDDCRFFLLGHSWGGTLGTAVLLQGDNQEAFKGWIEVDGGHDLSGIYAANIQYFRTVAQEQINLNNNISYWQSTLDEVNRLDPEFNDSDAKFLNSEAFAAEEKLIDDNVIEKPGNDEATTALLTSVFGYNPLTAFWSGTSVNLTLLDQGIWEDLSYADQLHRITLPTLLLWGRYDLVIPPAMGEAALASLGSTEKELYIFNRSGHSPMVNQPGSFAAQVLAFIEMYK